MDQTFIWSDGWWVEGDKGWFVGGMNNTLYCADLNTGECEKMACIPRSGEGTYRFNPYCVKCGNDIYCVPGLEQNIWIYNLDDNTFTKVDIERPERCRLGSQVWVYNNMVYIVVPNWNKVIEVGLGNQGISTNYYSICENDNVRRGILAEGCIYAVSVEFAIIYQFNLMTKKVKSYCFTSIDKNLFGMCFDGKKFWLNGFHKDMYVWDKDGSSPTLIKLLDEAEIPVYHRSVAVGEYVWFIPMQKERKILYINKETMKVSELEIYEENKISIMLSKYQGIGNYLLEYVRENRYLGLFSGKNGRILEIDAKQLKYQWKEYYFSKRYLQRYRESCKGVYYEGKDPLCVQACHMNNLAAGYRTDHIGTDSVGRKIYAELV